MSDDKKKPGECGCAHHGRVTCPVCRRTGSVKIGAAFLKGEAVTDAVEKCIICKGIGTLGEEDVANLVSELAKITREREALKAGLTLVGTVGK